MTKEELYKNMTTLYNVDISKQDLIRKSVQLGMDYQEQLIKSGIDIVFKELHNKYNIKSK